MVLGVNSRKICCILGILLLFGAGTHAFKLNTPVKRLPTPILSTVRHSRSVSGATPSASNPAGRSSMRVGAGGGADSGAWESMRNVAIIGKSSWYRLQDLRFIGV
jgi:hypothetical protein